MKRVAIIGGGISGLSAAWYLKQRNIDYVLFEASDRLGGVIRTIQRNGFLIEAGPDSFLSAKPWAADLARELGIGDQLIGSNDSQRKTYILVRGKLLPMPEGMQLMAPGKVWPVVSSPLFSFSTKLKMLKELVFPPEPLPQGKDESVAAFTERHFGREVVEKLANPLLAGVYGGDSTHLSARAVLPAFVEMEARHRSLARALGSKEGRQNSTSQSIFTSFRNGLQQFIDTISAQLEPTRIKLNSPVQSLRFEENEWQVAASGQGGTFTDVIVAAPAKSAASLIQSSNERLAELLRGIRATSSITVAFGFNSRNLTLPPGFGFLVPRSEGKKMIACTFVHNKFSHRAPSGSFLIRGFMTSGLELPDALIQQDFADELQAILGIQAVPDFASVYRWPDAMPQYEVGHLDRIREIEQIVSTYRGLQLIGNGYRGIGIPDCVREGKFAAVKISA